MDRVTVYPNPFQSRISLEISSLHNETAIVSMLNSQNKIIKMFSWYIKAGTNKTSLDGLASLPADTYRILLTDTNGGAISETKIIKK
jgi:coproporphyrinogen III oxidase-like Fe-S oxidoreductase